MIVEALLRVLMAPVWMIISIMPAIDVSIPSSIYDGFNMIMNGIGFFLPLGALLPILIAEISITNFKILMSVLWRIKSFIPTISGGG